MAFYRPAAWQKPLSVVVLGAALALPTLLQAFGQEFYIGFATRVLIFALAASSLNLILGFGGMVSLGHAAFLGAGAYVAAICQQAGINEALFAFPLVMGVAGLFALAVGTISLRTRGVYFIMITLAFAQMAYYLFISARSWGGDDGLPLNGRMTLAGFSLADDAALFYAALGLLAGAMLLFGRTADSRFGRTIQAIRENEMRMEALGYPVFRYRLVAFALGGAFAGLAGALLANLTGLASPNLLQWTQSGTLLVMVIIGGVGYLHGGVLGAVVLLLLEETLVGVTEHWHIVLGLLLLGVVLFAPKGVAALFDRPREADHG
ncbi:MAG TPA: branched-chain amino acid ABC transporter permease [Azonexus sp.]|nr:branched-chain amino acid ABC transporter permease [Azonexus sp.]